MKGPNLTPTAQVLANQGACSGLRSYPSKQILNILTRTLSANSDCSSMIELWEVLLGKH